MKNSAGVCKCDVLFRLVNLQDVDFMLNNCVWKLGVCNVFLLEVDDGGLL